MKNQHAVHLVQHLIRWTFNMASFYRDLIELLRKAGLPKSF